MLQAFSDRGPSINERHIWPDNVLYVFAHKRVVRAAEHNGVGTRGYQGLALVLQHALCLWRIQKALLYALHQANASLRNHLHVLTIVLKQGGELCAMQGAGGGEYADDAVFAGSGSGFDGGLHANDGQGVMLAHGANSGGSSGVASNDQRLCALANQCVCNVETARLYSVRGFIAIRRVGAIGKIDEMFVGKLPG